MKTPLTIALATLALGFATVSVPLFAQVVPGQAHGGGRLRKLNNTLGLTNAQKTQIRPILKTARQQAQAIKADASLTPEAKKAKLKEIHQSTRQQMQAILTPEQAAKLKTIKHHHGKKGAAA